MCPATSGRRGGEGFEVGNARRKGESVLTRVRKQGVLAAAFVLGAGLLAGCSGSGAGTQASKPPATISLPPNPTPVVTLQAATAGPVSSPAPNRKTLPSGVLASLAVEQYDAPNGVGVGFGSVWVVSHRANNVYRIDPRMNRVLQIDVGQEQCGQPGFGFGRVWLLACGDRTTSVVLDPKTNQITGSFTGNCCQTVFAGGSAWVTPSSSSPGEIDRLDPISLKPVATITMGGAPMTVGSLAGSVWVEDPSDSTISRIDPSTNKVVTTFPARCAIIHGSAVAYGALWLHCFSSDKSTETLVRVDPRTNAARVSVIHGTAPSQQQDQDPAAGLGSLWVRTSDSTITRLDPSTLRVEGVYPADRAGAGGGIAVGYGSLWVANFIISTVWRDRVAG